MNTTTKPPRERRILNVRETRRLLLEEAQKWGSTRGRLPRGTMEAIEADAKKLVAIFAAQMEPARGGKTKKEGGVK